MKMSESLKEKIDKMPECKNKETWYELQESENAYVTIPTIDKINDIYSMRKSYFQLKPLDSLKYVKQYYKHVADVYNNYDFILHLGFFESNIHVNEIDTLKVTQTTRNKIKRICESIDARINKLDSR